MEIKDVIPFELFGSIHASVFLLMPLASLINPQKKFHTFVKLFVFRAIILFVGNFINPNIAILDFFAYFLGGMFILPASLYYKPKNNLRINTNKQAIQKVTFKKEFEDLPDSTLNTFGIPDPEHFKDELYEIFIQYENAYSTFDYDTLNLICTNKYFKTVSNELNALNASNQKRIFENFIKNDIKIDSIHNNGIVQIVSALIVISFCDYVIDRNGNIIKGNNLLLKTRKFNVIFYKDIRDINTRTKCPNCNAPLDKTKTKCDYCGNTINKKLTWKINSINKIADKAIVENNNPIKMN